MELIVEEAKGIGVIESREDSLGYTFGNQDLLGATCKLREDGMSLIALISRVIVNQSSMHA